MNESQKQQNRIAPEEVSEKGSLGLLAMGSKGLTIWRNKQKEAKESGKKKG